MFFWWPSIVLPAGTEIRATWTWDNSEENIRNPFSPPRRIQWGPGSEDEMSGLIVDGLTVEAGWPEAHFWLSVLGHYLEIESDAKKAQRRQRFRRRQR